MKYTTPSAIALRLRGRLDLVESGQQIFGQNLGAKQVQIELIELVGDQVEAKLDMGLSMLYVLPVPEAAVQARLILASIVEKFAVAEILGVHYQQSQNAEMGGDMGYGALLLKQAKEECHLIGVNFPGIMQSQVTAFSRPEPMVLPGVQPQTNIPDVITRNYSMCVQRTLSEASAIDWG